MIRMAREYPILNSHPHLKILAPLCGDNMIYMLKSCWVNGEHVNGFDVFAFSRKQLIEKCKLWCPSEVMRLKRLFIIFWEPLIFC